MIRISDLGPALGYRTYRYCAIIVAGLFVLTLDSVAAFAQPSLNISGNTTIAEVDIYTAPEGDSGTTDFIFDVTLSEPAVNTVTVDYSTPEWWGWDHATLGVDYIGASGTLIFPPGTTHKTISIQVIGDTEVEILEVFTVELQNPVNATIPEDDQFGIDGPRCFGFIENDDMENDLPTLRISDVTAAEGDSGTTNFVFNVTLSGSSSETVTVDYYTMDDSAISPEDYGAESGRLTFLPGTTTRTIIIQVNGDMEVENNENFKVWLEDPTNAEIADDMAVGTILNDDTAIIYPVNIIHVDDDAINDPGPNDLSISDPHEDGTEDHPFDSLQEAIENAQDLYKILVHEGTYYEILNLMGKSIEISRFAPGASGIATYPVIDAQDRGTVVTFSQGEAPDCVLSGFVLTGGFNDKGCAITCRGASPTLRNCLIVGNRSAGLNGAVIYCQNSNSIFENLTIHGNYGGEFGAVFRFNESNAVVTNSILWGNVPDEIIVESGNDPIILYSDVQGTWPGLGNFDADPLFAFPGRWVDQNNPRLLPTDPANPNAIWIHGDYHLMSETGCWNPNSRTWIVDELTSPCIDAGDPKSLWINEPSPHGARINMGVYGGTDQASLSGLSGNLDSVNTEDFESGNFSKFDWKHPSGNDADWLLTSDSVNPGDYCAKAGSIDDNEITTLLLTLDCFTGEISFYYKISSEQHYDYLRFYIDGLLQDEWSGNEDWTRVSFPVSSGERTFEWTYSKDSSSSYESDTAWIDDIVFPVE